MAGLTSSGIYQLMGLKYEGIIGRWWKIGGGASFGEGGDWVTEECVLKGMACPRSLLLILCLVYISR
jgi:hypothetical protein